MSSPSPLEDAGSEICALCLHPFKELRRSHIIPDYHFRRMKDEKDQILLITPGRPKVEKAIQTGIFERLLCGECERHMNEGFENEVHSFFDSGALNPSEVPLRDELTVEVNCHSFRLYMLSILWRASNASVSPFEGFTLESSIEEALRLAILRLNPLHPRFLPFYVLSVEFDGGWTRDLIFPPLMGEAGEVPSAFFIVGGFLVVFILGATHLDAEMGSLLFDQRSSLKIRRMHVNDIPHFAQTMEYVKESLLAFDARIGRKR